VIGDPEILVVGGSVAAGAFISQLRTDGFEGRIVVIDQDPDAPYDRPPLSKEFLALDTARPRAPWWDARCELVRGRAISLDVGARTVTVVHPNGEVGTLRAEHVVIATGAAPIRLPGQPAAVAQLRTAADARTLRGFARSGRHFVILGAGTIGTELASSVVALGSKATLIDMADRPLDRFFAGHLGDEALAWITDGGVDLRLGATVERIEQRPEGWSVLTDAGDVAGDVVLSAVGARPTTDWLVGSGLALSNGISCDADGNAVGLNDAGVPGIHAIGDVSAWAESGSAARRHEDWTTAQRQGRLLARRILGLDAAPLGRELSYFWSYQFGRRIQVLGTPERDAQLAPQVVDPQKKAGFYTLERDGRTVAWVSINRPREFALAVRESTVAVG
jgi:3-phenylpropionate/trans-cinnamate dioxygenase ferredoxin reductase component